MTVRVGPGRPPERATMPRPPITGTALLARRASPAVRCEDRPGERVAAALVVAVAVAARGHRTDRRPWPARRWRALTAVGPPAPGPPVPGVDGLPSSSRSRAPSSPGLPAPAAIPPASSRGCSRASHGRVGRRRSAREMEEAVPEVVDVLRATVAAGINPRRALQAASEGAPPALEGVLGQAIQAAELGAGTGSALATAARAEGLPELVLAGEALDLAETTGAPPGPVLAGVAAAAADRIRSRQARMAATAQARLSASRRCRDGARLPRCPRPDRTLGRRVPGPRAPRLGDPGVGRGPGAARRPLGHPHRPRVQPHGLENHGRTPPGTGRPCGTRTSSTGEGSCSTTRWARGLRLARPPADSAPEGDRAIPRMAAWRPLPPSPPACCSAPSWRRPSLGGSSLRCSRRSPGRSGWVGRRRAHARRLAVRSEAAPAVLDLLGAALLAGLNPHRALIRVAERAPEALREDLSLAAAVLRLGGPRRRRSARPPTDLASTSCARRRGPRSRRTLGRPTGGGLAARAEALRGRARLNAEAEAGRRRPPRLSLVLCFLPAFVLLTVVPTIAGASRP